MSPAVFLAFEHFANAFQLDDQRSWTDGFTESDDYGQKVAKADMDRFVMRVGL